MDEAKVRRLAERISKIVAELLERRIKDPRLGFVTVTEARLTNDLREAKVFYTVFGYARGARGHGEGAQERHRRHPLRGRPPDRPAPHPAASSSSQTRCRRTRSGSTTWWRPPGEKDEELARASEGAQWAGDPDPYKKPADDDDWDEDGDEDDEDDEDA